MNFDRIAIAVVAMIAVLAQTETAPLARSAYDTNTGGYPWHDAAELNRAMSDYGYDTCPTDAPNCKTKKVVKDGITYGVYDPWRYYFRNCTSYVAWRVAAEFGIDASGLGNATMWNNNASKKGWTIDDDPEVGDVAHFEGNDSRQTTSPGHVAFVEEVRSLADGYEVRVAEYNKGLNGAFRNDRWVRADSYIDINGPNPVGYKPKVTKTDGVGEGAPSKGGSSTVTGQIDELGFVRTNHGSGRTELVTWHGAPHYTTLRASTLTGYPTISDPKNVTPLAIDVNGDGVDELGFVRTNHSSGRTELSLWQGSPHYTTHLLTTYTWYPAISDPANVTPIALDVNGDGIDELGFVRSNHSSGRTELSIWHGAPHYTTHHSTTLTGYPAIADPANVRPISLDVNKDKIDELGFVRTNHSSGRTELVVFHGAPHYTTLRISTLTGYPAISDPTNVTPIALDIHGDGVDELGFVRINHTSGRAELSLWHGSPHYTTHLLNAHTGYPAVSDPANVTPLAIRLA